MWYALILGGGSGSRMGANQNKVLLDLEGIPILVRSLQAFEGHVDGAVAQDPVVDAPCGPVERGCVYAVGLGLLPAVRLHEEDIRVEHDAGEALCVEVFLYPQPVRAYLVAHHDFASVGNAVFPHAVEQQINQPLHLAGPPRQGERTVLHGALDADHPLVLADVDGDQQFRAVEILREGDYLFRDLRYSIAQLLGCARALDCDLRLDGGCHLNGHGWFLWLFF